MKILIIGKSRSGTTVLASALGAHPDITMINEPVSMDWAKAVGTKHVGLKCTLGSNIWMRKRKSLSYRFDGLNRLFNLFTKKVNLRLIPRAQFSFFDLMKDIDAVVLIVRNEEARKVSEKKRTGASDKILQYRSWCAENHLKYIARYKKPIVVSYERLVDLPNSTLDYICRELSINYDPTMLSGAKYNYYGKELTHA